jgi:eukaryotic-like serine/threonine-protein kinase
VSAVVGHYNLLERIGEGGLGEVFRARDTKVGRTVALKLPRPGGPESRQYARLLGDARAAAALSHPNIATLFEVGLEGDAIFLAYEFVPGTTLRQQMSGSPMNTGRTLDLAVQVADALAEAHRHGVLHKDLRPDTIVETPKGSAKVLDVGMAAWTRGGQTRALAAASPGSVSADAVKIVSYASPEQALGGTVDARTDVFSLGVIVYEMLTGQNPFAGADAAATLINISQKVPPPPSTVNPALPKMVDLVLSRALAKDLAKRTESAAKLSADFQRCLGLVENRTEETVPAHQQRSHEGKNELLPLDEDRTVGGLWWLLAALGASIAAALFYWLT